MNTENKDSMEKLTKEMEKYGIHSIEDVEKRAIHLFEKSSWFRQSFIKHAKNKEWLENLAKDPIPVIQKEFNLTSEQLSDVTEFIALINIADKWPYEEEEDEKAVISGNLPDHIDASLGLGVNELNMVVKWLSLITNCSIDYKSQLNDHPVRLSITDLKLVNIKSHNNHIWFTFKVIEGILGEVNGYYLMRGFLLEYCLDLQKVNLSGERVEQKGYKTGKYTVSIHTQGGIASDFNVKLLKEFENFPYKDEHLIDFFKKAFNSAFGNIHKEIISIDVGENKLLPKKIMFAENIGDKPRIQLILQMAEFQTDSDLYRQAKFNDFLQVNTNFLFKLAIPFIAEVLNVKKDSFKVENHSLKTVEGFALKFTLEDIEVIGDLEVNLRRIVANLHGDLNGKSKKGIQLSCNATAKLFGLKCLKVIMDFIIDISYNDLSIKDNPNSCFQDIKAEMSYMHLEIKSNHVFTSMLLKFLKGLDISIEAEIKKIAEPILKEIGMDWSYADFLRLKSINWDQTEANLGFDISYLDRIK